jgi:hypothetical protein
VTKKQAYRVVFLQDGLRLYREPKREDPGGFEGKVRTYDPDDSGTISYDLMFANRPYADIRQDLFVIEDDPGITADEWVVTPGEDISLRFLPDGSIDVGSYADSFEDVVITRMGDTRKRGVIDIDPSGTFDFEVKEIEE